MAVYLQHARNLGLLHKRAPFRINPLLFATFRHARTTSRFDRHPALRDCGEPQPEVYASRFALRFAWRLTKVRVRVKNASQSVCCNLSAPGWLMMHCLCQTSVCCPASCTSSAVTSHSTLPITDQRKKREMVHLDSIQVDPCVF